MLNGIRTTRDVVDLFLNDPKVALQWSSSKLDDALGHIQLKELAVEDCKTHVMYTLDRVLGGVERMKQADTAALTIQLDRVSKFIQTIRNYTDTCRRCLKSYQVLLEQGAEWVSMSTHETLSREITRLVDSDITQLPTFQTILAASIKSERFVVSYAFHNYTDEDLRDMFPESGGISTKVDLFRDDIRQNFKQKFEGLIR